MEKFARRLKFYGIGFGLGLVFVFFFFRNRGCTWLPENRVKNSILSRVLVVSEESKKVFDQAGINVDSLVYVLDDGDVEFSESDKDGESKTYLVSKNGVEYSFYLPYESFVSEVYMGKPDGEIESTGFGKVIHVPLDTTMIYIDSAWRKNCLIKELGYTDARQMWEEFPENAKINFDKTDFSARPKPEHEFVMKSDSVEFTFKSIWYKTKINVESIEVPYETECELK